LGLREQPTNRAKHSKAIKRVLYLLIIGQTEWLLQLVSYKKGLRE